MNFRETLKAGTMVSTKRKLLFHKKHDTWVTTELPADTALMIWDFERFTDEFDPMTKVEIEFLHNADLWCLAIPHHDHVEEYLSFGGEDESEV